VILATPKKRRQRRVSGSAAGLAHFAGPVSTLQCFEDNSLVKAALDEPGAGRVLVVDGGASLRRALLGGNLAAAAQRNGWAGVVINGCVRDVAELGFVPSFCTACYRTGRTGKDFMDLAKPGLIKRKCAPNALASFEEYLLDYAGDATKTSGARVISKELGDMDPAVGKLAKGLIDKVDQGRRDVFC